MRVLVSWICRRRSVSKRVFARTDYGKYPGSLVFAAGDKVRPVSTKLKIGDNVHMCPLIIQYLVTRLNIEKSNFARLVASDNQAGCVCESAHGCFGSNRIEHMSRFDDFYWQFREAGFWWKRINPTHDLSLRLLYLF